MNYFQARQRDDGSGWHYTCRNDDRIWPVGYDSPYQTCPDCKGHSVHLVEHGEGEKNYCATCKSMGYIEIEPHTPHATKEEAYECATQYVIDTAVWVEFSTEHSVPRCSMEDCSELVNDGKAVKHGFGIGAVDPLCKDHRDRESIAVLVGTVRNITSS